MIWDDGRSGAAGCAAGEVALNDLEARYGAFRKVKGTVFETKDLLVVGRACGTDTYLSSGVSHWANISRDQHFKLIHDAREADKRMHYLFVTARDAPPRVDYWLIPSETVDRVLNDRRKTAPRDVLGIHIKCREGRYFLNELDVTDHHHVVPLNQEQTILLSEVLEASRRNSATSKRGRDTRSGPAHHGPINEEDAADTLHSFQVPVSGARKMILSVPIPITTRDVERLKAWIDLMTDILTHDQPAGAVARGRSREASSIRARGEPSSRSTPLESETCEYEDLDDCFAAMEPDDELEQALEGQRQVDKGLWQ